MKENLKSKVEKLPKSRVKLLVEVEFAEVKRIFEKIFSQSAETVELPGFRKGKAPRRLVIEAIGETRLFNQTVTEALNESLNKILKEKELRPVSSPKIQINQSPSLFDERFQRSLQYEAEFEVLPKIALESYKKIKISSPKEKDLNVTNEEIEQTLEYLRLQASTLSKVERPAKEGDRVEIDFQGFAKGVPLEKLTSQNHPLILGRKTVLEDIEKEILGMKGGEKKRFPLVLPKEARFQELAGKKVDFELKLKKIEEIKLLPLDDSFAKRFGKTGLTDLKDSLKSQIIQTKKERFRLKQEQELAEGLVSKIRTEDLPGTLLLREKDKLKENLLNFLKERGSNLESYLASLKTSEEKLDEGLKEQAKRNLLLGLALGEVAKLEKIPVDSQKGTKRVVDWLIEKNRT